MIDSVLPVDATESAWVIVLNGAAEEAPSLLSLPPVALTQ